MQESKIIRLPGVDMTIEMVGDAPTSVFVHGFGGDMHSWDSLWNLLPRGRDYLRYDLRGFGGSTPTSIDPFSHADDLARLLDALQVDRCDLVGASMGASVVLNLALSRPDRTRSLALVSPALAGWHWSGGWQALWSPITAAARSGDMKLAKALWLDHPLFDTARTGRAAAALEEEIARYSGEQWIVDRQMSVIPDAERLHELERPVLLMTGEDDLADFRLMAEVIQALAPDVIHHDAAGLGHLVHLEDPQWCHDKLVRFWANQS